KELEREIESIERRLDSTFIAATDTDERIAKAQRRLEQLKPWQRDEIKRERAQIERDTQLREREWSEVHRTAARFDELQNHPDRPEIWNERHGQDLAAREQRVADLTSERERSRERAIEKALRE